MVTLPGLPMFGHGQVEGLAEKYGMEYRRAYWDEEPDRWLVERHEREVFPLLRRRYLFAEVRDFLLYDFFAPEGHVNEDVFCYSNRSGGERSLVVYHNKFATARGWIKSSVAYSVKSGDNGDRVLVQRNLGEGLGLHNDGNRFTIFRDSITDLEYIRNSQELCEQGLYAELEAYKCHVFLDWREVEDNEWRQYAHLADYLGGRGVPSIEEALQEVFLQPIHRPFRELVNAEHLQWLIDNRITVADGQLDAELLDEAERRALGLLLEAKTFTGGAGDPEVIAEEVLYKLKAALHLPVLDERFPTARSRKYRAAVEMVQTHLNDDPTVWGTLLSWIFTHNLGKIIGEEDFAVQSRSWIDEWLLGKLVAGALQDLGLDESAAWWAVGVAKVLISHQDWCDLEGPKAERAYQALVSWLKDSEVQQFVQVNRYGGVLWFNHEAFDQLLNWMLTMAAVEISADPECSPKEMAKGLVACYDIVNKLKQAEDASEYQVVKLMEAAKA
jgi:hypothetical protein